MKRIFTLLLLFIFSVISLPVVLAQEKKESQFKLIEFHMALLKRGPKWEPTPTKGFGSFQSQHGAYVLSLLESGKAVIAGPLSDEGEILGVYVLRAKSAAEAKEWVDSDPGVMGGHLSAEMLSWWSEEVMKKPATPIKMTTTAYLGFLSRGPKWTLEKTPDTEELQKAHRANMNKLAEMKKLVVAGPFGGNGTMRGIFVFRVDSLEEAKELAATDPSVQAGRLAIDMHPWVVPDGVLP